ncbi:hypothetical protein [Bradyrhizobium sp. NBAIM14]|uniref:hypothetical protein n=1 Tax=Bradyrhizobium sp. NBAIM14 TaxID=2793814 RepID=UPI001CD80C7A|nr:hypothetical protein [Bradyrhizobium sp. NBAIM14]MCA1500251.1 hypothetical protein [Bradyrhizobium sp. NBAIM14]
MQLHHANTLEKITIAPDHGSGELTWPATRDQSDFSTSNRAEILALLAPGRPPKLTICLVAAAALGAGFALGWAGAWYGPAAISALDPTAQVETALRRMPDTRARGKAEGVRKIASGSRTAPALGQPSTFIASVAPKPGTKAPNAAQSADALEVDMSVTGSLQSAGPLLAVPETRPTTMTGWAVLDVRGGTAVLEGPDGIRMAARGDVVPGVGRIDSIVRWGNRWIVATARGLISTP